MMMHLQKLRKCIQIILEDLGKVKGAARGYGAISARVVGSDRTMLGDSDERDRGDIKQASPVKVSKAFIRAQALVNPGDA